MKDNIIKNYTLERYKKKYRNRKQNIIRFTKKEVEDFNEKHPTDCKNYLLEGRKWALIGNTYYQIPRFPGLTWFRNLKASTQVITSILLGGAVLTGIAVPNIIIGSKKGNTTIDFHYVVEGGIKAKINTKTNTCTIVEITDDYKIETDTVTLPSTIDGATVTSIGTWSFSNVSSKKLIVKFPEPNTITTIEPNAFEGDYLEVERIYVSATQKYKVTDGEGFEYTTVTNNNEDVHYYISGTGKNAFYLTGNNKNKLTFTEIN